MSLVFSVCSAKIYTLAIVPVRKRLQNVTNMLEIFVSLSFQPI